MGGGMSPARGCPCPAPPPTAPPLPSPQDPDWASAESVAHVWVPGGVLGGLGQDPPPGAERQLELRCTRPHCLWLPGGGALTPTPPV